MKKKFTDKQIEDIIKMSREQFNFDSDQRTCLFMFLKGYGGIKAHLGKKLFATISEEIEKELEGL